MLCQVQQQRKKTSVMIKWIETGEEDRPRIPLKMTMQRFLMVADELGIDESELLKEIVATASINYKLGRLLWSAVDYGQQKTKTVVFKTDEEFVDWMWEKMHSITNEDVEGLEQDDIIKKLEKIPAMRVLQAVIDDLTVYYNKLSSRAEKNVEASQQNQIAIGDHS